jgi:hypothetical protein
VSLASELVTLFHERDYKWKLEDGTLHIPTEEDMQRTLDKIAERVKDEPEGTILSVGRLLANKQAEGLEIYTYIGDYK